jgi:hypothetical protein
LATVLASATLASCNRTEITEDPSGGPPAATSDGTLPGDPVSWVKTYDPRRAWNGYTLALHGGRRPVLLDMNGRTVHSWPEARVKSRIRLLEDGSLLALALGRSVVEYDWEGSLAWKYEVAPDLPHHDVIRLNNGNTMFPVLPRGAKTDDIVEVDRAGEVVWRWSSAEHLSDYITKRPARRRQDVTHINSVQELPDNRWFSAGDERFRPGNLLISARNLNQIFIVDKASKKVVWYYHGSLDLQHEALMIPPGFPGEGNITVFDNGSRNIHRYRASRILEIDPSDSSIVWEYLSEDFYSPTAGVQQPLANGNIMVGSSRGGRIFEIDRDGMIVWQWAPPFEPVRPSRYPYDHCPQLRDIRQAEPIAVRPEPGYRHVDWPLYTFVPRIRLRRVRLERTREDVLPDNNACHELLLPSKPGLWVSYGIARGKVEAAGRAQYEAAFGLKLRIRGAKDWVGLFSETVNIEGNRWREQEIDLSDYAFQWVELCVETRSIGAIPAEPTEPFAFWNGPTITSDDTTRSDPIDATADELTADELDVRQQHLKALGYVN